VIRYVLCVGLVCLVCLGLWLVRNVRIGRKVKNPWDAVRNSPIAESTPGYRRRFEGDPARHALRRRAPIRRVS